MIEKIQELADELRKLNAKVKKILKDADFEEDYELSGIECDKTNPNQLMLLDNFQKILGNLQDMSNTISYLDRPIKKEGKLRKNERNKYELDGHMYSCGCTIEYLANDGRYWRYDGTIDDYVNVPYWCVSRVEHDGKDYYIVRDKNVKLQGLRVRIR